MMGTNARVEQLDNHKNQYIIYTDDMVMFQSYKTLVAVWDYDTQIISLNNDYQASKTTQKHLYSFIRQYTNILVFNKWDLCDAIGRGNIILVSFEI